MTEQSDNQRSLSEESIVPEVTDSPREFSDYEKRLRRDLVRSREQIRTLQNERDANVAAVARDRDEVIATIRNETASRVIRAELKTHALKAGIIDLDGLRLADSSALSLSDDGNVIGAEALIEVLRQEKPYLFVEARSGISTGTTGQVQRAPIPASPIVLDARLLSRDAWQAERARLLVSKV